MYHPNLLTSINKSTRTAVKSTVIEIYQNFTQP